MGVKIGFTSVLHVWSSALTHHPHVHLIVPGGGISLDGTHWIRSSAEYLLPVPVLSRMFRGKMPAMLKAAHVAGQLQFFGPHAGHERHDRVQDLLGAGLRHQVLRPRHVLIRPA